MAAIIAMSPHRRRGNPYTLLLGAALAGRGHHVYEYVPLWPGPFGLTPDVVHVHWPEQLMVSSGPRRSALKQLRLLTDLDLARRRSSTVIWTAHNLQPHDAALRDGRYRDSFLRFLSRVDGVVHLSAEGERLADRAYPVLADKARIRVPHGDLSVAYTGMDRDTARRSLGVEEHQALVLLFGRLKPYRGVEHAVRAFVESRPDKVRLLVAGACQDVNLAGRLRRLAHEAGGAVTLELVMLSDEELAVRLAAADLVLQPFIDVLHSGAVHLALGVGVPVLAPARGALPELQQAVGAEALHLYNGELAMPDVTAALSAPRRPVSLGTLGDWDDIARRHELLYADARR